MNHCRAVRVPIMIIRGPSPFHRPAITISFIIRKVVSPTWEKKRWRLRISPQHYVSPYTDQKVQYTVCHNFFPMRCPCANGIVNARFEDVRTFLHALFYKRCRVFVCQELSVNVPVGISDYGGSSFSSNSSYRSYQRFDMQARRKGQFCIVLTL